MRRVSGAITDITLSRALSRIEAASLAAEAVFGHDIIEQESLDRVVDAD